MLTVPPAPRYRMSAAPLVEAVAQVNFPIVARLRSVDGIAPLQDALFDLFPYMNQQVVQQVSLMIGPAGPAAPDAQSSTVYVFTDDDGWTLSVTVSSASLMVGPNMRASMTSRDGFVVCAPPCVRPVRSAAVIDSECVTSTLSNSTMTAVNGPGGFGQRSLGSQPQRYRPTT